MLKVFAIEKVKNTVPWTYLIKDFHRKEIAETILKKELQKTNQAEFRKKVLDYMLNAQVMIIRLITGLLKRYYYIKQFISQNQVVVEKK